MDTSNRRILCRNCSWNYILGGGLTIGGLFANKICGAYIREGLLSEFHANRGFAGQFYMRLSV